MQCFLSAIDMVMDTGKSTLRIFDAREMSTRCLTALTLENILAVITKILGFSVQVIFANNVMQLNCKPYANDDKLYQTVKTLYSKMFSW